MPVKARRMTSIDQVRGVIARGSGGGALTRIRDKQELRIRFMGEPDTWLQYSEHYDATLGFYPCADDGTCPGCAENNRTSKKFLASVIDMAEKTVIALVMPVTLAEDILQKYDKFNTLLDRVYELGRTGQGVKDTKYTVDYGDPRRADLSRFQELDLEELINTQLPKSEDIIDEDDLAEDDPDDLPPPPVKRTLPKKTAPPRARPSADLDDDDFAPATPAKVAKAIKKIAPPAAQAVGTPPRKMLRRPGA